MATRKLAPYDLDEEKYIDEPFLLGKVKVLADGSLEDPDTGQTIYDAGNGEIPQGALAGPPSDLQNYPLVHGTDTDTPSDAHHSKTTSHADIADVVVDTESDLPSDPDTDTFAIVHDVQEVQHYDGNSWATVANTTAGGASVSDDGTQVVASPSDVDYTTALDATDDGDGTASVAVEQEQIEDWIAGLLTAGDKLSFTYDDDGDTLTIDTSALDTEEVEDAVAALITTDANLTFNYDDANDTITLGLGSHASTHEKGGSDELTTFGDTTHDSIATEQGTVDGDELIGFPTSSSDEGLTKTSGWTTIDSNRPVLLIVRLVAETDGSSFGDLRLEVDESGGTTQDYQQRAVTAPENGSGARSEEAFIIPLPVGAQVNVNNQTDPNGNNSVSLTRSVTL